MDTAKFQNFIDGHALVIGGTGAIGEATVLEYAEQEGINAISICYRSNDDKALELQKKVEAKGIKFYAAKPDLLDSAAFRKFMESAVGSCGHEINAYANTSGISPNPPLASLVREDFIKVFDVNVIAPTLNTRDIMARAAEKGIELASVLVTSTNGLSLGSWAPFSVPYDQSKAALIPTIECLDKEYAERGLRLNGVAPGWVNSPMNYDVPGYEAEVQRIWRKRDLDVREVARLIVWLTSRASSGIHGVNLKVDGGYN